MRITKAVRAPWSVALVSSFSAMLLTLTGCGAGQPAGPSNAEDSAAPDSSTSHAGELISPGDRPMAASAVPSKPGERCAAATNSTKQKIAEKVRVSLPDSANSHAPDAWVCGPEVVLSRVSYGNVHVSFEPGWNDNVMAHFGALKERFGGEVVELVNRDAYVREAQEPDEYGTVMFVVDGEAVKLLAPPEVPIARVEGAARKIDAQNRP